MKNRQINILRFPIALALIGCLLGLTADRSAGAEALKKVAAPMYQMRGQMRGQMQGKQAIEHLEQAGLYNSLSAAVTAARYSVEARESGDYEAANPRQNYRTVFKPDSVEVKGLSGTG